MAIFPQTTVQKQDEQQDWVIRRGLELTKVLSKHIWISICLYQHFSGNIISFCSIRYCSLKYKLFLFSITLSLVPLQFCSHNITNTVFPPTAVFPTCLIFVWSPWRRGYEYVEGYFLLNSVGTFALHLQLVLIELYYTFKEKNIEFKLHNLQNACVFRGDN